MLSLPIEGVSRSVGSHNSDLSVVSDWIEASVLFDELEISATAVIDLLLEEELYESQDYAREFVTDVFSEIRRRNTLYQSPTNLRVDGELVRCDEDWTADPAYAFCLTLSLAEAYPKWLAGFGNGYNEQGSLFEAFTIESLQSLLPSWKTISTGWSANQGNKLNAVADSVIKSLYEIPGAEIGTWIAGHANDLGLDVVFFRDFIDQTAGIPVFMLQCASGKLWRNKVQEPNLASWRNIVSFASYPVKAMAIPFALPKEDLRRYSTMVEGPLFERYRLLSAGAAKPDWPSEALVNRLYDWVWPRVSSIPLAN